MLLLFSVLLAAGCTASLETSNLSTLKLVSVITRHGSRSPLVTYKYNDYPMINDTFWPDGVGQLTRYGKRQMFTSGANLRSRYADYLSSFYSKEEMSATSNPMDRDMASTQCLLTGLYPPMGFQVWNRYIDWQPIPVYEEQFDVSKVIDSPYLCPRARSVSEAFEKEFDEESSRYFQSVYDVLTNFSGERVLNSRRAQEFYEIFQLNSENGYPLPTWALKIFPEPLTTLSTLRSLGRVGRTRCLRRLTSGPLLGKIVNQFTSKIRGLNEKKVYIQAGHDNTLLALLAGLGIADFIQYPGTSSYVAFELHEISTKFFVEVMFFQSCLVTTPKILNIPRCPRPCPLNGFVELVADLVPDDWIKECEL